MGVRESALKSVRSQQVQRPTRLLIDTRVVPNPYEGHTTFCTTACGRMWPRQITDAPQSCGGWFIDALVASSVVADVVFDGRCTVGLRCLV